MVDPAEALADLKQISTQVERAVIIGRDGSVEASTLTDDAAARRIAESGAALYAAADRARRDLGRPSLTQLEVATPSGSVFAVREGERTILATTGVDPTVGLIFYDLKTCLRNLDEDPDASFGVEGAGDPEGAALATAVAVEAVPPPPAVGEVTMTGGPDPLGPVDGPPAIRDDANPLAAPPPADADLEPATPASPVPDPLGPVGPAAPDPSVDPVADPLSPIVPPLPNEDALGAPSPTPPTVPDPLGPLGPGSASPADRPEGGER
jgi:predicted regulator of Ras-like GTPase activity (Roadblock/LC7/MglB family)